MSRKLEKKIAFKIFALTDWIDSIENAIWFIQCSFIAIMHISLLL